MRHTQTNKEYFIKNLSNVQEQLQYGNVQHPQQEQNDLKIQEIFIFLHQKIVFLKIFVHI